VHCNDDALYSKFFFVVTLNLSPEVEFFSANVRISQKSDTMHACFALVVRDTPSFRSAEAQLVAIARCLDADLSCQKGMPAGVSRASRLA
jgi:hypothetical protein